MDLQNEAIELQKVFHQDYKTYWEETEAIKTHLEARFKALGLYDVSTRLSQMITELDNKVMNTTYDDGEHLAWDKDDIRCMQRTLQLLND